MGVIMTRRNVRGPRLAALAMLIGLCGATPARAQLEACEGLSSNVEMTGCAAREAEKLDKELNRIWPKVLAALDKSTDVPPEHRKPFKQAVIEAQRGWVSYKSAQCEKVTPYEWFGGTGASFAQLSCVATKTKQRIDELKSLLGEP